MQKAIALILLIIAIAVIVRRVALTFSARKEGNSCTTCGCARSKKDKV